VFSQVLTFVHCAVIFLSFENAEEAKGRHEEAEEGG
jgi:hypothetical protein